MKLSEKQKEVLQKLKSGLQINYFRGIGTKYKPSAEIIDKESKRIESVSVATVKALRDLNLIKETSRESYHSIYTLN